MLSQKLFMSLLLFYADYKVGTFMYSFEMFWMFVVSEIEPLVQLYRQNNLK